MLSNDHSLQKINKYFIITMTGFSTLQMKCKDHYFEKSFPVSAKLY